MHASPGHLIYNNLCLFVLSNTFSLCLHGFMNDLKEKIERRQKKKKKRKTGSVALRTNQKKPFPSLVIVNYTQTISSCQ